MVLLFDVNETLLDMTALDPVFEDAFGNAAVRATWFAQMLQLALTATVTGELLAMVGERRGIAVDDALRARVRDGMTALPAHPDLTLVAAHAWDVAGARAAGARTVFVARPGQVLDHAVPPPDRVIADLSEL